VTKVVKAVLFDFEGTTVDFQWNLIDAEADLAEELEKMQFTTDCLDPTEGYDLALNRAIELAGSGRSDFSPEQVKERIGLIYDRYDLDALSRWKPLPCVMDTLTTLKNIGFMLGLITNAGSKAIKEALFRFNLTDIFDVTITRNDVLLFKPSGQGILAALSRLNIKKHEAVFVGDSVSDIMAARDAGIKVISVLGGQCTRSELLEHSPDYTIDSIGEVMEIVSI